MSEWQPIETAPKEDWKNIILILDARKPATGFEAQRMGVVYFDHGGWLDTATGEFTTVNPTHWMPLPAPPKEG